jgi:hypothetical protein
VLHRTPRRPPGAPSRSAAWQELAARGPGSDSELETLVRARTTQRSVDPPARPIIPEGAVAGTGLPAGPGSAGSDLPGPAAGGKARAANGVTVSARD